jgi:hypothetical protein
MFSTRRLLRRPAAATELWGSPAQVHDGEDGAAAGEAGDAVDAGGLNGLGEGHRRFRPRHTRLTCQHLGT